MREAGNEAKRYSWVSGQITGRTLTLNETRATSPRVSKLLVKGKMVNFFLPLQTIQLLLQLLNSTIIARKQPRPHVNEQAELCSNNTLPTRTGNKLDVDQGPC